jgi:hypothetical protein
MAITRRSTAVTLGMPAFPDVARCTVTTPAHPPEKQD